MNNEENTATPNNSVLTRQDVRMKLCEELGLTYLDANHALNIVLELILEKLASGGHVEFRDFGVFEVVVRKPRTGRNPNSPTEAVPIPERNVVKFKPSKRMKEMIAATGV